MSQEQRAHVRQSIDLRVDYIDPKGGVSLGVTGDISRSGMFLKHSPGLSTYDTITVMFQLPTGPTCKLQANVMRSTKKGSGLLFVAQKKWAATSLKQLEAYFDEVLPEEAWPEDALIYSPGHMN